MSHSKKDMFAFFKEKTSDDDHVRASQSVESDLSSVTESPYFESRNKRKKGRNQIPPGAIVSPPPLKKVKVPARTISTVATATSASITCITAPYSKHSEEPCSDPTKEPAAEERIMLGGGSTFCGPRVLVPSWTGYLKNKGYIKQRHGMIYQVILDYAQGILDLIHGEDFKFEDFFPRAIFFEYEMFVETVRDIAREIGEYRDFCLDIVDVAFIKRYIHNVKTEEMAMFVKNIIKCPHYVLIFEPYSSVRNYKIATEFGHIVPKKRFYYPNRSLVDYTNYNRSNH